MGVALKNLRLDYPWASASAHACAQRKASSYTMATEHSAKSVRVVCDHCKRWWRHPNGEEMYYVFTWGWNSARDKFQEGVGQMFVQVPPIAP